MCLGDVIQHHAGEPLGQRNSSKGHKALSHQWLAGAGCSFVGYVKQAGSEWLEICLFGLFQKQLDV